MILLQIGITSKMNSCSRVMKDGKVCGKSCYREKCHNRTIDRMNKDKPNHKRLLKAQGVAKDMQDAQNKIVSPLLLASSHSMQESRDVSNPSHSKEKGHASHGTASTVDAITHFRKWVEMVEKNWWSAGTAAKEMCNAWRDSLKNSQVRRRGRTWPNYDWWNEK